MKPSKWLDYVISSQSKKNSRSPFGDPLPQFPPEELQRNTTGLSGDAAIRHAFAFYEDTLEGIRLAGGSMTPAWHVMDFGVGWGRVARLFMNNVPLAHIYGIDVDSEFIELTRGLFGTNNFLVCEPFPPTLIQSESTNLVTAYSVFSHLSESACLKWVVEFARILRPGGYFSFTTRHSSFFDYLGWAAAQKDKVEGYTRALGALFPDLQDARSRYAQGEIVHATSIGVSGGGVRNETYYGETFIPPAYVKRQFAEWFDVAHHSFDGSRYDQACFVMRRR
jgi:SAM-dependent methyltransferase